MDDATYWILARVTVVLRVSVWRREKWARAEVARRARRGGHEELDGSKCSQEPRVSGGRGWALEGLTVETGWEL